MPFSLQMNIVTIRKVPLLTEGGDIDMAFINILAPAIIKTKIPTLLYSFTVRLTKDFL